LAKKQTEAIGNKLFFSENRYNPAEKEKDPSAINVTGRPQTGYLLKTTGVLFDQPS
jgi:hypothetical protein